MVARKYASVLMQREDWEYFYDRFSALYNLLSTNKDFADLLSSRIIKSQYKVNLILDLFETNTKDFENLVCLLAENSRLAIIDKIFLNMQQCELERRKIAIATIYTANPLDVETLKSLESDLSKKFDININMSNVVTESNNLKIVLDSLGYEINISPSYLKQKIKEFILKAI